MINITELQPGQEVQAYMKLGLALEPKRNKSGSLYYAVPSKPQPVKNGHLTRFIGWVVSNDVSNQLLTVQVSKSNSLNQAVRPTTPAVAQIHWVALQKLRVYSDVAYEGTPETPGALAGKDYRWPGTIFNNVTRHKAYRTLTEVKIKL